jgi:thiamine biosynthesis lipoprotein
MKATQIIMGLPVTVEVVDGFDPAAAIGAVFAELHRIDSVFSTYRPDSEISRLNRGELTRHHATPEMREVLDECDALRELTGGYFDAVRDGLTDPSGYVKGWAVYRAARLLDARHITRYCLNAGGDMQLSGQAPGGGPWRIGVVNPLAHETFAKLLALQDRAVATSGTAERGYHIYNPHTGRPVTDPVSLTVVGDTIDRVDALATAAFCMGEEGLHFLLRHNCEAMIIHADGQVVLTEGFRQFLVAPSM